MLVFLIVLISGVGLLSVIAANTYVPARPLLSQEIIKTSNRPPYARSGGPYVGLEGTGVLFDGSRSCDSDGDIVSYVWTFDTNSTATGPQPIKQFENEGNYTVTLVVTDNQGATSRQTTFALISDQSPIPDFTGTPLQGPAPLTVQFTDQSASYDGIAAWHWVFQENVMSSVVNPQYTYSQSGLYSVTLTVTEADGDLETVTKLNYVNVSQPVDVIDHTPPVLIASSTPQRMTAGTTITSEITILNDDSPLLNQSTFQVTTPSLPNWSITIEPSIVTLDPSATVTVTVTLSPPSSIPPQQYNLSIHVQHIDYPSLQTVHTLPIIVEAPPPGPAVPSIAISPRSHTGLNGSSTQYNITIRNNDAPTLPATTFTLNTTVPPHWTSRTNQTTLLLAPGDLATLPLTITAPRDATPDDYIILVTVIHGANGSYNAETIGTFKVIMRSGDPPPEGEPSPSPTPRNISVRIAPETPTSHQTITFTIQSNTSLETLLRIRIYVDNTLIHQANATDTYTFEGGPFPTGSHTFYIEVEDDKGVITRVPANQSQIFTVTPSEAALPTSSWLGLLAASLPLLILNSLSYLVTLKHPSEHKVTSARLSQPQEPSS